MPRDIRTYSRNGELVQERRNHIVNHALRLFLAKGYDRTTIRELAESCGMTEGAIYRYIGSKDDIPASITPGYQDRFHRRLFEKLG